MLYCYTMRIKHAVNPINEIAAKLYDKYASPDHTKARRAQANGFVKICQYHQ